MRIRTTITAALAAGALALALTGAGALARQGDLDPSFSGDGKLVLDAANGSANGVVADDKSRVIAAGYVDPPGADPSDFAVARLTADGSPDPSFGGGDGIATLDVSGTGDADQARAVSLDGSGRIYLAGSARTAGGDLGAAIARFTDAGAIDSAFGGGDGAAVSDTDPANDESLDDLVIDSQGRPVAAGTTGAAASSDLLVARFNAASGAPDAGFAPPNGFIAQNVDVVPSADVGTGVTLDSINRVIVGGYTSAVEGEENFATARFSKDGVLDPAYDAGPIAGRTITSMSSESGSEKSDVGLDLVSVGGDKIVVSGAAEITGLGSEAAVLELTAAGQPDNGFSGDGKAFVPLGAGDDRADAVTFDGDGNIVVAGATGPSGGDSVFAVARFTKDGSVDTKFNGVGYTVTDLGSGAEAAEDVGIDPTTKRIVVAGRIGPPTSAHFALARYFAVPSCAGMAPTIVGGKKNDTLKGTPEKDVISGADASDNIKGLKKGDVACGGDGKDTISGGSGGDRLYGGKGTDAIKGGKGKDRLYGGKGRDTLVGGPGKDKVKGGPGRDSVRK